MRVLSFSILISILLLSGLSGKVYSQHASRPPRAIRLPVQNDGIYLLQLESLLDIQPGDTLLIPKSLTIRLVKITGIHGTKERPIVITQEDTSARIGGYKAYGLVLGNATHFKLVNVHVNGKDINNGIGILMAKGCSDFVIENCSSDNSGIGFQCKVTPERNDPTSLHPTPMKNIRIVNCSASNNKTEGFYIGYSAGADDKGLSPILIDSVFMNNIKAINNGWDGIQVTRVKNFVGRNFYVSGFGQKFTPGQNSGIALQSDVTGSLDGFEVTDGNGAGLTIFGRGELRIKNGRLKNVGKSVVGDGIYVNDYPTGYNLPPLKLYLENITIDGFTRFPVNVVNRYGTMKPGVLKNVVFKNGTLGRNINDNSQKKPAK
jgi:hypothetical protein